jgi:hypothetical protein
MQSGAIPRGFQQAVSRLAGTLTQSSVTVFSDWFHRKRPCPLMDVWFRELRESLPRGNRAICDHATFANGDSPSTSRGQLRLPLDFYLSWMSLFARPRSLPVLTEYLFALSLRLLRYAEGPDGRADEASSRETDEEKKARYGTRSTRRHVRSSRRKG